MPPVLTTFPASPTRDFDFSWTRSRYPLLFFTLALITVALFLTDRREADASSAAPARGSNEVAGLVTDDAGEPISRAWITDGHAYAFTDTSGAFVFEQGTVSADTTLTVAASGYRENRVTPPAAGSRLNVSLERQPIKGIHFDPTGATSIAGIDSLIDIVDRTELNAIVITIKEGFVYFDTDSAFFRNAGVVSPIIDLPAILTKLHDHGIYSIARIVVFKDSAVAEAYPWLGIVDWQTGNLWRDVNGMAWVNPMNQEVGNANIDLAREVATLGFDEIQYDYVRFPTDGDLSRVSYGLPNTQENRQYAIEGFLERTRNALIPSGTRLSADVFGYTMNVDSDLGIGQNASNLSSRVDYLSPMIYPSHWPDWTVPGNGRPNDYPYDTVAWSMSIALDKMGGSPLQLRPWLQDFTLPGMAPYGANEVRAQIAAAEDLGITSWLVWTLGNPYHVDAFAPDPDQAPHTSVTPVDATRPRARTNHIARGARLL